MNCYGNIDNISSFIHPKYNKKFKYMNDEESISLAKIIYQKFIQSGYRNIVVIESGTSPLLNIINKLRHKDNLNFVQIKIPRSLNFNLYGWFETYLSRKELKEEIKINNAIQTREYFLKKELRKLSMQSNDHFTIYDSIIDNKKYCSEQFEIFNKILRNTKMSNIFKNEFLLFDEYINAGTIIRNFNYLVRLFNINPQFKVSAFCMFLDKPDNYSKIAFTLYDNSSELACYTNGAYPFENRIDLIGYYYYISNRCFKKIDLKSLRKKIVTKDNIYSNDFYDMLNKKIDKEDLLSKLKNKAKEDQIKDYLKKEDIVRYLIKYLDIKIYKDNKIYDFLDQVFELYAPAWSPMPVIFHLDYWQVFENDSIIDKISEEVKDEYKIYRNNIVYDILNMLINNRIEWENNIDKLLGGINENY